MWACLPPGPVSPRTPCPHPRSRHLPPGAAAFPIHLASPGPWRAAAAEPCGGGDAGCRGSSFCPAPFPSPPAAPFRDVSSAPRPCVVGVRGGRTEDPWRGAEGPGWLDSSPAPSAVGGWGRLVRGLAPASFPGAPWQGGAGLAVTSFGAELVLSRCRHWSPCGQGDYGGLHGGGGAGAGVVNWTPFGNQRLEVGGCCRAGALWGQRLGWGVPLCLPILGNFVP